MFVFNNKFVDHGTALYYVSKSSMMLSLNLPLATATLLKMGSVAKV